MSLQISTTNAFNLEDILNAITPDNIDSQIHHPDHEFARYRRSRIPESMGYLEEEDSSQTNDDESSGEDDNDDKDKDADKNDDIAESGDDDDDDADDNDDDDGSSSGDVDDDVQNKKSTIAHTAEGKNAASVVQEASQQALKPDDFKIPLANDFKIPVANGELATKATVGTNETVSTNNTGNVVEISNSSSSEVVNPSVAPEVANRTSGNETTNSAAIAANVNATDNATRSMTENTTLASQSKENPVPVSSNVVPQYKAEPVTPAGINVGNAESGKNIAEALENIQALNSNIAVSNATAWPQDMKPRVVMFSEQEKEKNYTVNPQYNVAYQIPTAKYMGKANDEIQINRNTPAANETVNARQQTAVPIEGTSKRTGIQKKVDELMTAEEIVEDMDSEKEEEEERDAESGSGSGSGSGNIEQPRAVKINAAKSGNNAQAVAKEKTASLSANEAAFLSSMEADEDSSGSHLEVTSESGSGSGENIESAVVAEINHMKENSIEKEQMQKKKEQRKVKLAAKQQQQSKSGSPVTTSNSHVQTKLPQKTAKIQNIPSNTKQAANTGSYAQNTQHQSLPKTVPQAYKQPQQQATYTQQQQPIYNQQTAQSQPKQAPIKGKTVAQHQAGAAATQQYNQNRVNAHKTSDTTESAKIQNAIEKKKDRAEKNKMRAANSGAHATVQAQIPAQGHAALSQGSVGKPQGNAPLPQTQPQRLVQATVPSQAGKPVQANKTNQWAQQKPVYTANQGQNIQASKAAKLTAQNTKSKAALSVKQKSSQPKVTATAKSMNKSMTNDAYGEAADLLKTSSKIELKENDDNLPGATGDDITEEDLQKLQSISVNDAAGVNENDFGDLMSSLGDKKEAKKSKQPTDTVNSAPKAKSWTMVFNGTESEGNLPGSYGDDYLDDGSSDDESGSGNEHGKSDIEMQIESSIGSSFESTIKSKRGKNKSASGSGSGSGDEYASELLPGDYGSESPLNIDEEGSGDDDDDESGEGLDFMSGNHASGSGNEIDNHIHALLQAHVESPNEQKPVNQPERIRISNATRSQGQGAFQPINYPSVQREYVSKVPDAPRLEQEQVRTELKSQQLDNDDDDDDEVSGSGSGETGESSGHSNEGSGSETSFALPFAQPNAPKPHPFSADQKVGQYAGLGGQESSVVQQAVAHVAQNILNNIRQYHGNMTVPATPADSRTIKLENDEKEQKQAEVSDEDEDSGSGSPSSGAIQIKSEDAASGNKKYDSDDNDDDEAEATPEEAETKELKSGKEVEAGQRGQIQKGKEANAHKHEELQPQDEDDEEDPKPKYNGFTVSIAVPEFRIW